MVATILTAFVGTLLMGVYANRPFAIALYMGENAFVAFTVVRVMGFSSFLNQFDGFHEFLSWLKMNKTSVELRGC